MKIDITLELTVDTKTEALFVFKTATSVFDYYDHNNVKVSFMKDTEGVIITATEEEVSDPRFTGKISNVVELVNMYNKKC